MRSALLFSALSLAVASSTLQQPASDSYVPPNGFVPDSATAVRIAVAVWIPIYGKRQIMLEQPYVARLQDSVWTVTGTLRAGYQGGTAIAMIAKRDGRVLYVKHGQ